MAKYEKPVVEVTSELAEGVYANSGAGAGGRKCGSIYMNGVYQQPSNQPINDGYKLGRGCEGCPAQNGGSCRFQSAPQEMNWDGDFRPAWEVQGHLPDEKGY